MSYQYAYLLGDLFLLMPWWIFLYFKRKDLRTEILIVSILAGIGGPLSELWFLKDYWRPELFNGWSIGLEDVLFGFFIGGISCSIYEEMFGRKFAKRIDRTHHWSWF